MSDIIELWYNHLGKTERAEVERLVSEIERLRRRLNEVDAQLTAEGRIHARENMALRAEKDADIKRLTDWGGEKVVEICKLRADNERLRAALCKLINACDLVSPIERFEAADEARAELARDTKP